MRTEPITVEVEAGTIEGDIAIPAEPRGVVLFAHGSGSSRFSPRNRAVAGRLGEGGLATVLLDLLTPAEERRGPAPTELVFDIDLLAGRLAAAVDATAAHRELSHLPLGLFGASTGAAAALVTAAGRPVGALVSRGGRPDLAGDRLAEVRAPTLLIVGSLDTEVLALNREAATHLGGEHRLSIVEGATHLFEEPGALEQVARLAGDWFAEHLRAAVR